MDQASGPVESRERAVSSEPCSTRPNPFDDSDLSSRKRRRTSLSGASTTLSVDSVDSPTANHHDEAAMKIETDPTTPHTPEQQHRLLDAESRPPPTAERSSRVTINVRTPSRPLEVIPSSPVSPMAHVSAEPDPAATPANMDGDVKVSIEESDADMPQGDAAGDTPATSTSEPDSPSVEILPLQLEDSIGFDTGQSAVGLQGLPPGIFVDPSPEFPYRDAAESYPEAISRLTPFLPTHEAVSRDIANWIDLCLAYLKATSTEEMHRSVQEHHELWASLPELVLFMSTRKMPYPRGKLWQEIMAFYSSFGRLTAFFVEYDLKLLNALGPITDQTQIPSLVSLNYIHAFAILTRRDEIILHNGQLHNGDPDCDYAADINIVLSEFHKSLASHGGPVRYLKELVQFLVGAVLRFPKITEVLAYLSVLIDTLLRDHIRKNGNILDGAENPKTNLARGYQFFKVVSSTLSAIVEKHVNHLSFDTASTLVNSLTEIYRMCLSTEHIVARETIEDHQQSRPPIAAQHIPEAMAHHWKFTIFTKMIMSSQMQLRVMAVSSMCNDLVAIWRKHSEVPDEASKLFLHYIADFLLGTGLVSYILGPTCHPEITIESSNIVGFLVVSQTYTNEHTDALWQTVTSTQDPRVSDALLRMIIRITQLFTYECLIYLCEKLSTVPVEAFSPSMRELFDVILRQLPNKFGFERTVQSAAPYNLCVRLIRLSSVFGPQSPTAYYDVQQFALQKFKDLLVPGPSPDTRRDIYFDCLRDISIKSETALGSLWVLSFVLKPYQSRVDLHNLTVDQGLTRILVEELEAAIPVARKAGFPAVISGPQNTPRKDLIMCILYHEPSSITRELGLKLWDMLVGSGAACQEDRDVAWQIFNSSLKKSQVRAENPFVLTCFAEYLPTLDPESFCPGALEFVREAVLPLVNDPTSIILDDSESADRAGIEQLWRMILTAPHHTIEQQAIQTLVNDVYIDSRSIISFPHYRARKVHLTLVRRCLSQLSSAAAKLKAFNEGTSSSDDDSMVIVATGQQVREQELLFIRSLAVLREFHRLHQAKAHFSAPDLRSWILEAPHDIDGESAELKYQSFDGNSQTDILPLNIGKQNTAASLLASLREATGFTNYRIYYRGRPFVPRENDICKSLEDLQIHNGIILVKRESDVPVSPTARVRLGASPVELELLGHFEELWEYLTMEEKLAQEIYSFLTKLPADENILHAIQEDSTPYKKIFPLGQPFRSLYGVHALQEYLISSRRKSVSSDVAVHQDATDSLRADYSVSLARAMSLVAAAILDPEVIAQCSSHELQVDLSSSLVRCFVCLLKDPLLPASSLELLDANLLDRLVTILSLLTSTEGDSDATTDNIFLSIQSIFESGLMSELFWEAFRDHSSLPSLLGSLLLHDNRLRVRQNTAMLMEEKICQTNNSGADKDFLGFFWPVVSALLASAPGKPATCDELFGLCLSMFKTLRVAKSPTLKLEHTLASWCSLLLSYTTFEDVTQPEKTDAVAHGLIQLLHSALCWEDYPVDTRMLPNDGVARRLFWKHLFPPFEKGDDSSSVAESHRPIISVKPRAMLIDVMFALICDDRRQLSLLIRDLDELVPFDNDEDGEFYAYDLLPQFERSKAIRASCGYVGLKNLSNTCYLNSLFTQLFMNIEFRRFILDAWVQDREYEQQLLFQTQNLFANMQGSIRRFMNPEECVYAIKTYEDSQIDIHNQMDVDEFYNLLFDRWEGQLQGAEAKKQFRSFYGGQLVQQVSSKECEHISERLEPFSAIQCDIKGKSSLEESLQAYVDGEIMAGENKYKCSSCDRHVDAVKRACLKDIPDNLIFHLKRFDFNLRTLQRSKINDYFAFPHSIDMCPYTIDHLSNPDKATSDVFELVGVLVHSGTAESGHYYSYIRERPSSSESPAWFEFNDDVVSSWDPTQMESSCYGGTDYRANFENGVPFDKNYSAYMLFYQRASSLAREQALLQPGVQSPLRVSVPDELGAHIERENASILRRHCLYDPGQITFVRTALDRLKKATRNTCTGSHRLEDMAIQMALGHLDQVASRTKDTPDFLHLVNTLLVMASGCVRCSLALVRYFFDRPPSLRWLVQRSPEQLVRQGAVDMVIQSLHVIRAQDPFSYGIRVGSSNGDEADDEIDEHSVISGMLSLFKHLFEKFEVLLRSWPEVFGFMLSFVNLGREEIFAFLEMNFLHKLMLTISADPNLDLHPQFTKLAANVARRMATRPPSYENIIALVEVLISSLTFISPERPDIGLDRCDQRLDPRAVEDSDGLLYFARSETRLLLTDWGRGQASFFIEKLIGLNQNFTDTNSIILTLMDRSPVMEEKVFRTLRQTISGQITQHHNTPFLRVAVLFCERAREVDYVNKLMSHISQECMCIQNGEGRAFFSFQRKVWERVQEHAQDPPVEIFLSDLERIPEWAPGLLGYYDSTVSKGVEDFLNRHIFKYGPSPDLENEEYGDDPRFASTLVAAARELGMRCLMYLRDNYVARRIDVSPRLVEPLERVVKQCAEYFNLKEPSEDPMAGEFLRLSQSVLEPLSSLAVAEDLEEDGSGWENSSGISEQPDSLGDASMPTDVDLQ